MNNQITELEINNFKSIKHIKMDCKRINVIIGRPNVGKSNILEALALYNAPYSDSNNKILADYIRYEKLNNLFFDLDKKNPITIKSNLGFALLSQMKGGFNNMYEFFLSPDNKLIKSINENDAEIQNSPVNFFTKFEEKHSNPSLASYYGHINDDAKLQTRHIKVPGNFSPIKKYHFKPSAEHKNHFSQFLRPPFGDNLFTIIEENPRLWDEFASFFNQYGLDLLVDKVDEKLDVQKKAGRYVTKIPYSLAADTLQRIIFHLAAIETNNDSVILFEEPESHSFPPYIQLLAERIIKDENNQYFIATHSPYLLTPFIEQCPPEDIAIFVARYEKYETKIKVLSEEEINNIMDTGIDLFFNIRAFEE